jgi:hypothetical protein
MLFGISELYRHKVSGLVSFRNVVDKERGDGTDVAFHNGQSSECEYCKLSIRELKIGNEQWYYWHEKKYFICTSCFVTVKPIIIEYQRKKFDKFNKMPLKLVKVEEDILAHRNYVLLDDKIKQNFERIQASHAGDEKKRKPADNKVLRKLWSHLYQQTEYTL